MATTIVLDPPSTYPTNEHNNSISSDDYYSHLKTLQRQLEFGEIQEEYVKDELKNLRREHLRAQEEVKRIQSVPLVIGQFMEMIDSNNAIVGSTTGSNYYVRILSTINRELLKPSASVALHRHSNALVDVLPPEADSSISLLSQSEKPDVTYNFGKMKIVFNSKEKKPIKYEEDFANDIGIAIRTCRELDGVSLWKEVPAETKLILYEHLEQWFVIEDWTKKKFNL